MRMRGAEPVCRMNVLLNWSRGMVQHKPDIKDDAPIGGIFVDRDSLPCQVREPLHISGFNTRIQTLCRLDAQDAP